MTGWHDNANDDMPDGHVRVTFRDGRTAEGLADRFMWNHDSGDRANDIVGWERL